MPNFDFESRFILFSVGALPPRAMVHRADAGLEERRGALVGQHAAQI